MIIKLIFYTLILIVYAFFTIMIFLKSTEIRYPTLIVMCGIPGSGKSTLAHMIHLARDNCVVISTDLIREALFDDANSQENNELVFETAFNEMKHYIRKGYDVIFDATNITEKSRKSLLSASKAYRNRIMVLNTDLEECIKRQDGRDRKVPEDVIRSMAKRFVMPTEDEGWDDITIIDMEGLLSGTD